MGYSRSVSWAIAVEVRLCRTRGPAFSRLRSPFVPDRVPPAPLSLGLLRAFPREYQCPSADRLWSYIALIRVLLREYGRNPAEIRLAWGSDAFEKFRLGEYACRGDLLSAGLAIKPLHSSQTYTIDLTNVGPAPRIRGTLTAANLPAVGDFISACLLDPASSAG